ncbi:MAG: lysophospholipase [Candidatus Methylumidiphilus sp.]
MHYDFAAAITKLIAIAGLLLLCAACAPVVSGLGPATVEPVLARAHFVAADGAVLPVRTWLPPGGETKAVILALHGFNDYSNFFIGAGIYLSGQGIACYAYDQRGFGAAPGRGLWPGTQAYVDDLRAFAGQVRRRHPGVPLYVLGESMGGAVAIAALASARPPPVDGLILSAPAVWGRSTMPWWQLVALETTAHTVPWLRLTGEGLHVMASDNIEMLRALGRDPLVIKATRVDAMYGLVDLMDAALDSAGRLATPTLVLYGEKDEVVPREPVMRMLAKLPARQTRAAFYADGYHLLLRDLQAEKPWRDIAAWIVRHDAALPSGAELRAGEGLALPAANDETPKIWRDPTAAR